MKNLLRETFSHHKAGRQLAWSQPPFKRFTCRAPSNLLTIIFSITLSFGKQCTTTKEREATAMERNGKTPLIYMPLRNCNCISLSCAKVYCVWLSNGKMEQRRDELAAEPPKLLSVWWSALTGGCLLSQT